MWWHCTWEGGINKICIWRLWNVAQMQKCLGSVKSDFLAEIFIFPLLYDMVSSKQPALKSSVTSCSVFSAHDTSATIPHVYKCHCRPLSCNRGFLCSLVRVTVFDFLASPKWSCLAWLELWKHTTGTRWPKRKGCIAAGATDELQNDAFLCVLLSSQLLHAAFFQPHVQNLF